jgi:cellulose synthase/poly-beta-1,6-N-acetylglucosamine synthase-like glycosyltransferase/EAL domain-containing protein (putative c-di-GMP-specific phosphodiesterase class I)
VTTGRLAIVLTVSAWMYYVAVTVEEQFLAGRADDSRLVIEAVAYLVVVTGLAASAIAYLSTRIGFFYRARSHHRAPRVVLDEFFDNNDPSVTVLVPSYQEDERTIRMTLLSAALQEQPNLRVVLLLDDPPTPRDERARLLLEQGRALPGKISQELARPGSRFRAAAREFAANRERGLPVGADEVARLTDHYRYAVTWLHDLGSRLTVVDHADDFLIDHVLGRLAKDLQRIIKSLEEVASADRVPPPERLRQLYRRLTSTFTAELSSFERKRYVSLSHEPNKAMNLNSYIGLMGGVYRQVDTPVGQALIRCEPDRADLIVPDPDFVLTLDADSVLLPEYSARMVHALMQGAHARHGVIQTPYSSFPGAATRIERISGATTDLQHLLHQGMTHYGATFWVGANAVLRKKALDDIREPDYLGDWEIHRFIQDRTVIEDTESTIDMEIKGWGLLNYPERLAYSATPPDFGSLCIQRQRWANGGLLILHKLKDLVRQRRARGERTGFGELFLRINYMASIFWSSLFLLVMFMYPFNADLLSPVLLFISVPYFLAMASDLRLTGYKRTDVFRIYGFNLILLPVNLSGAFSSLLQLLTGEKSAFKRTPKVRDRTTTGVLFLILPWALIALSVYTIVLDVRTERWVNLAFASLNAVLATYAVLSFVGLRNTIADLWAHLRSWLYRPIPTPPQGASDATGSLDLSLVMSALPASAGGSRVRTEEEVETALAAALEVAGALEVDPAAVPADPTDRDDPEPGADSVITLIVLPEEEPADPDQDSPLFSTIFEPIVDLETSSTMGFRAITRMHGQDRSDPRGRAHDDVRLPTEVARLRSTVRAARDLPEGMWLCAPVASVLVRHPHELTPVLESADCPVIVEVDDLPADTGSSDGPSLPEECYLAVHSTGDARELDRIQGLEPTFLKIGGGTVAAAARNAIHRAEVTALVSYAASAGCTVIAEGIETPEQEDFLRRSGIRYAQGPRCGVPRGMEPAGKER